MSSKAPKIRILSLFFVLSLGCIFLWTINSVIELKKSTKSGWFDPPTEVYSSPLKIKTNQSLDAKKLSELFITLNFRERGLSQSLGDFEYTFFTASTCEQLYGLNLQKNTRSCFLTLLDEGRKFLIEVSYKRILKIHSIFENKSTLVSELELKPMLLAKLSNKKPIKRTYKKLSQIPRYCIDAVLAIEDDRFLKHKGVSLRGILRAAVINFKSGRISQGGSTLTQQLVKNKFLTSERTLLRKIKEAWLSLLLEVVLKKDEILESYLNYIYWGQSGPYAIHGIEEASKHYFGKSSKVLNLSECSLLAGAVKGPGIYGPHKEKSKPRQEKVLARMKELSLITKGQEVDALAEEVRVVKNQTFAAPKAPYYVDAVFKDLESKGFEDLNGLKIFTNLDFFIQKSLEKSVDDYLSKDSKDFYGSFIIGNPKKNSVLALASGKSLSQNFNSAMDAKRQIGSIAKPFVYLTAFTSNSTYKATTEISNEPFVYEYEGQSWSPKNYSVDKRPYYPLFEALAKSKNIPTVRLMSEFGYKKVYKTLMNFGFDEFAPITPSLALGSFETSPYRVLGAFMALSRRNSKYSKEGPFLFDLVEEADGTVLIQNNSEEYEKLEPHDEERMVLEMMKNTLTIGTARRTQILGLKGVYAGKTGTTNQHKDAWFVALSPSYTFVNWLGESEYTKRQAYKLTGATAALPIWMKIVKNMEKKGFYTDKDWPVNDLKPLKIIGPRGESKLLLKDN